MMGKEANDLINVSYSDVHPEPIMCNGCVQCRVPIPEDDEVTRDFLDEWGGVQYADTDTVMSVAQRISEQNAELMERLANED